MLGLIPWFLGGVFVLACVVWFGTYVLQFAVVVGAVLFRIIFFILQMTFGVFMFIGWWIVSPKTAMASVRREEARRAAMKEMDQPSPYGEKPFRRRAK